MCVNKYITSFHLLVASLYEITVFPMVVLFDNGGPIKCTPPNQVEIGSTSSSTEVKSEALRVKQCIVEKLEQQDRLVVQSIPSEAFKSQPHEFKHVSPSEHVFGYFVASCRELCVFCLLLYAVLFHPRIILLKF